MKENLLPIIRTLVIIAIVFGVNLFVFSASAKAAARIRSVIDNPPPSVALIKDDVVRKQMIEKIKPTMPAKNVDYNQAKKKSVVNSNL